MVKLTLVSLKQIIKKIKGFYHSYVKKIIWLWIVVLSLINSYIFGFLSQFNSDFSSLSIVYNSDLEIKDNSINQIVLKKGSIVASKNGTKYYFIHCGGVGRINEENKIYFNSTDEAEKEGYEIASGCTK